MLFRSFNPSEYQVITKDKKLILEKIPDNNVEFFGSIDNLIYQIPKMHSTIRITPQIHSYDLLIEQDNDKKEFRIKLSKFLREQFLTTIRSMHEDYSQIGKNFS